MKLPIIELPKTYTPTHQTGGLPGFPAIDMFGPPGSPVGAPEDGVVTGIHLIQWDGQLRVGGWTMYFQADSGDTYFLTHFATITHVKHRKAGELLGQISTVPNNWWPSHIHEGKHHGSYAYNGETHAPPAPFSLKHP